MTARNVRQCRSVSLSFWETDAAQREPGRTKPQESPGEGLRHASPHPALRATFSRREKDMPSDFPTVRVCMVLLQASPIGQTRQLLLH